ncbi:hypothetical protein SAMN05444398_102189 [Roseovarius pacificus]|uniref:Uncharacterized protein n=1 Tax=Roseovarius pacificus TaxID=337701 RepID=A0A1M7A683_9RHOB|nr:hypothetical protein SAMN05444398_102189 [Roseovarius pacificus]
MAGRSVPSPAGSSRGPGRGGQVQGLYETYEVYAGFVRNPGLSGEAAYRMDANAGVRRRTRRQHADGFGGWSLTSQNGVYILN